MKQRFECKKCSKRYKALGKNDMCFFCDKEGWYRRFGEGVKKK